MGKDNIKFEDTDKQIDDLLKKMEEEPVEYNVSDRIRTAHEIKKNPPQPGYMKVEVKPAIYSLDLNTDAHWWFNHSCTVFPLLLDQSKRTHVDIRDSFKPERRLPDFNYTFIIILVIGLIGLLVGGSMFGFW